jgi:hypothetical protein
MALRMSRLTDALAALDVQLGTPVRDLCAQKKWRAMNLFGFPLGIKICPFPRIAGQILPRTSDGSGQWFN